MYRLLKLRRLSSYNSKSMSSSVSNNLLTRTCAFCNHNFVMRCPEEVTSALPVYSARSQSTNATNANSSTIVELKKKKKKTRKKYAELLEVTGNSSIEKKAAVSKLTSKHLSLLAIQPDIDLNELFQLKKPTNTISQPETDDHCNVLHVPCQIDGDNIQNCVQNTHIPKESPRVSRNEILKHTVIEPHKNSSDVLNNKPLSFISNEVTINDIEPTNHEVISLPENVLQELESTIDNPVFRAKLTTNFDTISYGGINSVKDDILDQIDEHESELDLKINKEKKNVKIKLGNRKRKESIKDSKAILKRIEIEQTGRQEALTRSLVAHLDACVNCGLLSRGLSTLYYFRSRRPKFTKLADGRPYNVILSAFAKKGNVNKVKDILRLMDEDNLEWSLETYASAFECMGRNERNKTNLSLLETWMRRLMCTDWTVNDIIIKNTFVNDQRDVTVKAIRWLIPDFVPNYPPPDSCYSCSLLQELNVSKKVNGAYKSPGKGVLNLADLKAAAKQQIELEYLDQIKVKSIEKRNDDPGIVKYYREKLSESEKLWKETISNALKRDLDVLRAQNDSYMNQMHLNLYPFLRVLPLEQIVEILMKEIRVLAEGSESFSPSTNYLHRALGCAVLAKYEIDFKQRSGVLDKVNNIYYKYCKWYNNPSGPAKNPREQWQLLAQSDISGASLDIGRKQWSNVVLCNIGKFLYNILLRDLKVDVNIMKPGSDTQHLLPAFYTVFRSHGHTLKEEIKPHPALVRLYRGAALDDLLFDVSLVPMLSPPVPWTTVSSCVGGYVLVQPDLVRLPFLAYQQRVRMEQAEAKQLYPAMDALNQLGSVPWTVNERILDVVLEIFNNGGSTRLDIPLRPSAVAQPPVMTPDMTSEQKTKVFRDRITLKRKRAEMYSLWCDALYKLSLANHFRKQVFWLPHNMDFRGRVYPCPPHLNHLSSDMSRSLLQFAKAQPLGPKGLDWLMIHLINLTGCMKRDSVQDRLEYARSILPDILDSAKNPLMGKMWWATNEEPWQVLATCMEIEQAIESGNPEAYTSRFPVHQDGSCNGLQHYAALGRDKAGGESVNLTPNTRPQDVYSSVAELVEKERAKDAAEGVTIAQILEGFVRRKVIKQTVMTTVYGVTRYGARLQIARQLRDIEEFPKEYVWNASSYLVMKTFYSLREMFTSTKEIQDWFTECARQISHTCGQNVEWITPLGLPVVQPYVRFNSKSEESPKAQKLIERFTMDMFEKPNIMKQKNGFPPNFVHSLDSCHMMLTSVFCEREGITFVSVHDCFWTHPCSVEIMNQICRKQFVALHSEPILEKLSQFLIERFGYKPREGEMFGPGLVLNGLLKKIPLKGDLDLDYVLESVYFFS